ncbi:MAG: hypothetical protein QW478_12325, partial [Candidatus Micrarchaeaceae archaeon]
MNYYATTLITTELLHSFLMYNTYYFYICSNSSNRYICIFIRRHCSQYKGIYHGGLLLHLLNVLRNALYPSSLRKENVVVRGYVYSKNADYPYSREILQEGY